MRKSFSLPLLYLRERGKGREMPCNHTCISPAAQTDSRKKAAHSTNVQWRARRGKGTEENRGGRGMARGRSKKRAASPVLESVWTVVVVVGCCWLLLVAAGAVCCCRRLHLGLHHHSARYGALVGGKNGRWVEQSSMRGSGHSRKRKRKRKRNEKETTNNKQQNKNERTEKEKHAHKKRKRRG